jgi:hypothetical protein
MRTDPPTFALEERIALRRWAAHQRRVRGAETPEEVEARQLAEEAQAERTRRRRRRPRVRVVGECPRAASSPAAAAPAGLRRVRTPAEREADERQRERERRQLHEANVARCRRDGWRPMDYDAMTPEQRDDYMRQIHKHPNAAVGRPPK